MRTFRRGSTRTSPSTSASNPTIWRTYDEWRQHGYQVKRGEKGHPSNRKDNKKLFSDKQVKFIPDPPDYDDEAADYESGAFDYMADYFYNMGDR